MNDLTDKELVQKAIESQKYSYSPYSKYKVGAALLCKDGKIFTGTNIENASYPCGLCAERVAMSKAISEGNTNFVKIAIAGSSKEICTPCGLCRQFMAEFSSSLKVLCANVEGKYEEKKLSSILPSNFESSSLK
ncbi:cytidine deaminase [Treponema pectinovorum]|uniref:cytidine deaminase n=1 Tax=Treponema pectinovorum TaxID=164 RepID=UPI0011CAF654|nr:cytidine deaminase [Treponema pectinovorum]